MSNYDVRPVHYCNVPECGIVVYCKFLCRKHYMESRNSVTCSSSGCNCPAYSKGLCRNHYERLNVDKKKKYDADRHAKEFEKFNYNRCRDKEFDIDPPNVTELSYDDVMDIQDSITDELLARMHAIDEKDKI